MLGFYLIMFAFIEVPLVSYLVAPEWTGQATARFNAWLNRNGRKLAIGALGVFGIYLIVKGIAGVLGA